MAKEFKFPDVGEGIHEGTIVKWHFKEGDAVKADQTIVEVETDKAVVELPSPNTGTILKINHTVGQVIKVGEVLVVIGESGEKIDSIPTLKTITEKNVVENNQIERQHSKSVSEITLPSSSSHVPIATPSTRKLARELGVDLSLVKGSGPGGRITDDDVRTAKPSNQVQQSISSPALAPQKSTPSPMVVNSEEGDQRIPLTGIRKVIAQRMTYSKTHIPHACGMDFVDVTRLVAVREKEKSSLAARGVKLTYLPFVIKACTVALRKYPSFNAHFDSEKNELIAKKAFNIGIAVDTPDGLIVPVIKNVEKKSIMDIASEIENLAALARERKLKLEDLKDATFTITNIGSVGGMFSTPIINPPEVAIMGIHRIRDMPMVFNGRIEARKVMGVSLCFDHRVVDGALATEFMNVVKQHLEDPDLLLVEMV